MAHELQKKGSVLWEEGLEPGTTLDQEKVAHGTSLPPAERHQGTSHTFILGLSGIPDRGNRVQTVASFMYSNCGNPSISFSLPLKFL